MRVKQFLATVFRPIVNPLFRMNPERFLRVSNAMSQTNLASIKFLGSSLSQLPSPGPFTRRISGDEFSFQYKTDSYDDLNILARLNLGGWESESRKIFASLAKFSDLVLDIGSYTGIYAMTAATSNSSLIVHAFEPNPSIFDYLKTNIALNKLQDRVHLHNCALGNKVETVDFYMSKTLSSTASFNKMDSEALKIQVSVSPLDQFELDVSDGKLILIKIDAEGAEESVIEGSSSILRKHHPIILMEALSKYELEQQARALKGFGYENPICIVDGEREIDLYNHIWFVKKDEDLVKKCITKGSKT